MLGVGVMLNQFGGNEETYNAWQKAKNQKIKSVRLEDNRLSFELDNGTKIQLFDDGQSCCESRYIDTDDDLTTYAGATLLDLEQSDVEEKETEYDTHEISFVRVTTDKGTFTVQTHNEHNGYYGGFALKLIEI